MWSLANHPLPCQESKTMICGITIRFTSIFWNGSWWGGSRCIFPVTFPVLIWQQPTGRHWPRRWCSSGEQINNLTLDLRELQSFLHKCIFLDMDPDLNLPRPPASDIEKQCLLTAKLSWWRGSCQDHWPPSKETELTESILCWVWSLRKMDSNRSWHSSLSFITLRKKLIHLFWEFGRPWFLLLGKKNQQRNFQRY